MLNHLISNIRFYFLLIIWWQLGVQFAILGSIVVVLSGIFFKSSEQNDELLIGFWFVLIMSDSLDFAATAKNAYMVLFAISFFIGGGMKFTNNFSFNFLPYFLVAIVCLFFADNFILAIQKTISYILLFITVPNYIENLYQKSGVDFFKNLIYFAGIILAFGLILYVVSPLSVIMEGRYKGYFFRNPNGLGIFSFLVFILLATLNEFYPSLFSRREKYVLIGIVVITLLLTRSRSAIVSVVIFYVFRSIIRVSPILAFVTFIVTLVLYQFLADNFSFIVVSLGLQDYFRIETLDTGSGRTIAWKFAWDEIQKNIFFGKGISYTEYLFKRNYVYLSQLGHQGNAHNSYLTIWLDTGLIGLILFLFAFVSLFIKGARNTSLSIPIMYSVLFSIFFESWLTASLNPFTIILLIIITLLASDNIERYNTTEEEVTITAEE